MLEDNISKGELLFSESNYTQAKKHFNISIVIAFNNLGVIAFYEKEYDQAINFFLKSLAIDPFYKNSIINYYKAIKINKEVTPQSIRDFIHILNRYLEKDPFDKEIAIILQYVNYKITSLEQIPYFHLKDLNEKEIKCISTLKSLIKQQSKSFKNKPHRNLIITGIPGSGINTLSDFLNNFDNIKCFDDIIDDFIVLPEFFSNMRNRLIKNINTNNTNNIFDKEVIIGCRQNILQIYLSAIQEKQTDEFERLFKNFGYRIIAIVRDPVKTIMEWNSNPLLPETLIEDHNLSSQWKNIKFLSHSKYERQAQIWQLYAEILLTLQNILPHEPFWHLKPELIKIYKYEQIIFNSNWVIDDVCEFLSLPFPKQCQLKGESIHRSDQEHLIHQAVLKYCPARIQLGYEISDSDKAVSKSEKKLIPDNGFVDYEKYIRKWQKTN